jgi:hypothetical protein
MSSFAMFVDMAVYSEDDCGQQGAAVRGKWQFTARGVFLLVAILGIVSAGVFYVRKAQERSRWKDTGNDFKWVAMALYNFHDVFHSLPYPVRRDGGGNTAFPATNAPDAKALSSWRLAVLPFSTTADLRAIRYDQAWNSPVNFPFHADGWASIFTRADSRNTKMFAITGPGTAFGDGKQELPHSLDELDADTILIVEVRESGVHWMEPGDFDIRTMPKTIDAPDGHGVAGVHPYGFHVIFADGSVWRLRNDTPFEELAKFFTIESAKRHDREQELGSFRVDRWP